MLHVVQFLGIFLASTNQLRREPGFGQILIKGERILIMRIWCIFTDLTSENTAIDTMITDTMFVTLLG